MKTNILFVLLAFLGLSIVAKAQDVNIPDANFKNYLLGNSSINTDGNEEISIAEASAFTGEINVNLLSISDLTGIEAFTSLTSLICSYNLLTDIDVSLDTSLTSLICSHNSLTSLDVSNNTNLTWLDCDWNQLTNLDVSNNTALTILSCEGYLLTSLDVSANTALTSLDCSYNSLTSLDVSANTTLTMLDCYSNPITYLDVSANTALVSFKCSNNALMSLNMQNGNNSNLFYFTANGNPNLACILVDDTAYMNLHWLDAIDSTASFNESGCPQNTISASVNPANSGTITGVGNYYPGENVSLTANAVTGYAFTNWTENGIEVSADSTFSFIIYQDSTFVANFSISTDISEFNKTNSFIIYPNPNSGKFTIDFDSNYNGELNIRIYSAIGIIIKEFNVNKSIGKMTYSVDLEDKTAGIYYIDILTKKDKTTKTIIIN